MMIPGPALPKPLPPKKPDSLLIERLDKVGVWLLRPPTWAKKRNSYLIELLVEEGVPLLREGMGWGVAE